MPTIPYTWGGGLSWFAYQACVHSILKPFESTSTTIERQGDTYKIEMHILRNNQISEITNYTFVFYMDLSVCCCTSRPRILPSYGDVIIAGVRLKIKQTPMLGT